MTALSRFAASSRASVTTTAMAAVIVCSASVMFSTAASAIDTDPSVQNSVASVAIVQTDTGTGTAFAISADTLLTADHVVKGAKEVAVRVAGRLRAVQVRSTSSHLDLATLYLPGGGMHPLVLRPEPAQLGETVYAVGAALGGDLSLTRGIVSGHRDQAGFAHVQTDATVNPGNSGGPLLDDTGNVLGVVVSKLRDAEGMALAVPATDASAFLQGKPAASPSPQSGPTAADGASTHPTAHRALELHWAQATLLLPVLGLAWLFVSRPRRLRIKLHAPTAATTNSPDSPANKGITWQP